MNNQIHPVNESLVNLENLAPTGYKFSFERKTYRYRDSQGKQVSDSIGGKGYEHITVEWIHPTENTAHCIGLIFKPSSDSTFAVVKLNHSCRYGFVSLEYACTFLEVEAEEIESLPDVEFNLGIA